MSGVNEKPGSRLAATVTLRRSPSSSGFGGGRCVRVSQPPIQEEQKIGDCRDDQDVIALDVNDTSERTERKQRNQCRRKFPPEGQQHSGYGAEQQHHSYPFSKAKDA